MSLNILSMIDAFGVTAYGGAGKVFIEVNKVLADMENSVNVICRSPDDIPDGLFKNITFHTYRDIAGGQIGKIRHYRKWIKHFFLKQIAENRPDLILLHSSSAAFGLDKILKSLNIPIIYYFHSPWNKEYEIIAKAKGMLFCGGQCPLVTILSAIRKRHERKYLNLAFGIITLSESMQQIMLDVHRCAEKIPKAVISGGADGKVFHPALGQKEKKQIRSNLKFSEDDFLIITSRRLVSRTGVDILIKAFAEVKKRHEALDGEVLGEEGMTEFQLPNPDLKLILTGGGSSENDLKRLAFDLGIENDVFFTGYVSEKKLAKYYRCSDLFVMPTKFLEGFGLSTVEAMASGLPVIGTDIGGTPEILRKISDELIISECSVEAIADKIIEFLSKSENALDEWRKRSAKYAKENYTWEKHVEKLLEFVGVLTEGNKE